MKLGDLIDELRTMPLYVAPGGESSDIAIVVHLSNSAPLPTETRRLYGKDAHCPERWAQWLDDGNVIPPSLSPGSYTNLLNCVPREARYLWRCANILLNHITTGSC